LAFASEHLEIGNAMELISRCVLCTSFVAFLGIKKAGGFMKILEPESKETRVAFNDFIWWNRIAFALGFMPIACAYGVQLPLTDEPSGVGGAITSGTTGAPPGGGTAGTRGGGATGIGGASSEAAGTGGKSGSAGGGGAVGSGSSSGAAGVGGGGAGVAGTSGSGGGSPDASSGGAGGALVDAAVDVGRDVVEAGCAPESNAAFCTRLGKECGMVTGTDNCGATRSVPSCGTCTAPLVCGGAGTANACGERPIVDRSVGGTVSSSSPGTDPEDMTKAFDKDVTTKWLAPDTESAWIAYTFGGNASRVIVRYTIVSANDVPERDPQNWQLQGSNDGVTWTTVDAQTNQTFADRFTTNTYDFTNTTAYRRYRLRITANGGDVHTQLSEIGLFGP
jgi:hypothetical protein